MNVSEPRLDHLYQEVILDHNKRPRNFKALSKPTQYSHGHNPLCGDDYHLFLLVDGNGKIEDVGFQGAGCAISKASASMMTTMLKGLTMSELRAVDREALLKKLGIPLSAVRLKCALLSLHVLRLALGEPKDVRA